MNRVLTAIVAIPIVLLITLFSSNWMFAISVGFVSALAVEEFLSLAAKKGIGRPGRWFLALAALVAVSFIYGTWWVLMTLVLTSLILMTVAVFGYAIDKALGGVGMGLAGVVYCSLTLGFLNMMPRAMIIVLFAIIWIGDSAAYYGGRAFGRHLLAPRVSPKKTVEGSVAGLIGSVAVGTLGGTWFFGEPWMNATRKFAAGEVIMRENEAGGGQGTGRLGGPGIGGRRPARARPRSGPGRSR